MPSMPLRRQIRPIPFLVHQPQEPIRRGPILSAVPGPIRGNSKGKPSGLYGEIHESSKTMDSCAGEIILSIHQRRLGIAEVFMVVHRACVQFDSASALKNPTIAAGTQAIDLVSKRSGIDLSAPALKRRVLRAYRLVDKGKL